MPRPLLNADPSMATLVEPPPPLTPFSPLPPRLPPVAVRELRSLVNAARADARRAALFPSSAGTTRELRARADRLEVVLAIRAARQRRF